MFNQALTALGSFFSRAFWLGVFAPVASAAFLHLLIASQVFPHLKLDAWIKEDPLEQVTVSALAVMGLILLSYAISPFTPLLRGYLDGSRLPAFVRGPLREARYKIALRARRRIGRQNTELDKLRTVGTVLREALADAAADKPADPNEARPAPTPAQNKTIADGIADLWSVLATARVPTREDLQTVGDSLSTLLRERSTMRDDPDAERLGELWAEFVEVLEAAVTLAEADFGAEMKRSRLAWALPASEATAVGDTRQLAERYSETMYGVSFGYLWPRLQVKLGDAAAEDKALEAAQTQIEFAVLALALSMTVPLVWLPLIGLHGTSLPLLAGVAAFGPVAWVFFYQLIVQSQAGFGGVVQALIDVRRLKVLSDMSLPCPTTSGEERALWEMLEGADQGSPPSLRYSPAGEAAA